MKATICMGALIISVSTYAGSHVVKKKVSIPPNKYAHPPSLLNNPPITVWIHGTRFIRRPVFHTFFKDTPSLKLASDLAPDYHLHHIAKTLHKTAPEIFPWETLYLFGWSGKLREKVRLEAAEQLYKELHRITAEYKMKYKTDPIIRIIGHSHGGNVALYLGKMAQPHHETLRIKELVLLACPVQTKTKTHMHSDIFEQTYAIYSTLDLVQVLAPQFVYNVYR